MSSGKAMLGVLAGIAAGAVLGVLFAPEKGSNTRKNISRKTADIMDAMNDKIDKKFDEVIQVVTGKMKKSKTQNETAKAELVD